MTSLERVQTALDLREPDRVPVFELCVDPRLVLRLGFRSYDEYFEEMDIDAVILDNLLDYPEGSELAVPCGKRCVNEWGVELVYTDEITPMPVGYPLRGASDLADYRPPEARFPRGYMEGVEAVVRRYQGHRAVLGHSRAVFADSWNLLGMEGYMIALFENPDLVLRIGDMVSRINASRARQLIDAGVDLIFLGDDYAFKTAPLISPDQFRRFVVPGLSRVVEAIHEAGGRCIKHTDGNIWSIIDAIVDTGADCVGPLEPGADMDLARVKSRFGDRVAVMGNVDLDMLCRGAREDVERSVRLLIRKVAPGGGYVLSSGNSITGSVKTENYLAMVETASFGGGCVQRAMPWAFCLPLHSKPPASQVVVDWYEPPDPPARRKNEWGEGDWDWETIARGVEAKKRRGELAWGNGERLFDRLCFLRGFENLMIDFATDEPRLPKLTDMLFAHEHALVDRWLAMGVDAIWFHTDIATQSSLMISPDMFRRYLRADYKELFQRCRREGAHVYLSSDGRVTEIVEDLVECGVSTHDPQLALNP